MRKCLELNNTNSTPGVQDFDPSQIPWQHKAITEILWEHDYSLGVHESLFSGSVGSAKSMLLAHLVVRHCMENVKARCLLVRKALPDLKATIFQKILEHLDNEPNLMKDRDYYVIHNTAKIVFRNGAEIISRTCADKKYKKVRSLELSMAVFEELTEMNEEDQEFYHEVRMRVGRLPHIKTNLILSATNPDSPSHWVYKYFITSDNPMRHVYYSITEDNPFLPDWYIEQLKSTLDPKMAARMLRGEWIEIAAEVVYYSYDAERQKIDTEYKIDLNYPIHLTFDFNIGEGKPFSSCAFQFIKGEMHIFAEVVVEGMRTLDSCDEWAARGFLNHKTQYMVNGDATGRRRDTRSNKSDYDIIKKFLDNFRPDGRRFDYVIDVPRSNGSIRDRHNLVNAYCRNELGEVRLFVYKGAPTADEGLRLTQLKKGGQYIENDSAACPYQHITTAIGYGLKAATKRINKLRTTTVIQ